jgi:sortase A
MLWRWGEKVLFLLGILAVTGYAAARLHTDISSRLALDRFNYLHVIDSEKHENLGEKADFTLWNPKRVQAYQASLRAKSDLPIAVLRIPRIRLEVPIFDGTDELTLNRGAGRILGTAEIGQFGDMGIAAHRDGFFRRLKDIETGDFLQLETPGKTLHFVVERTEIVQPEDISVLADTRIPSLTLVTCFPFYFVGNAPQRFIVRASSTDFEERNSPPTVLAGQISHQGGLK